MNILKLSRNVAMTLGVVVGAISSAQAVPILTFGQVGQANVVTGTRVGANNFAQRNERGDHGLSDRRCNCNAVQRVPDVRLRQHGARGNGWTRYYADF